MRINTLKIIQSLLIAITLFSFCQSQDNLYKLVLLSQQRGAACLDGSPPAIYIH